MKKLFNYLCLIIAYNNVLLTNNLEITNLTPGQVYISLETMKQTIPLTVVPANLNPILNDVNEPDPKPTIISFDNSSVQKISIIRFSPNMPQIIYYDNQNTFDANQQIAGMKSLSLFMTQNKMIIWNDFVEINNFIYSLNDLNSYVVRINHLKDNLSQANLENTKKLVDDLISSINLVNQSDMANALSSQITIIQTSINAVLDTIKIMQASSESEKTPLDSEKNLTTNKNGSKDLNGYIIKINQLKDDVSIINLDATQKQLDELTISLNLLQEPKPTPEILLQITKAQATIDSTSDTIKIIKTIQAQIKEIQDLQSNLALGNNNLTGTNKPYKPADDSIDRAQRTLNGFKQGLPTLIQAHVDDIVTHQIQALHSAMNELQNAIDQMQTSRMAVNYEELLPPSTDLQTFQNT